MVKLYRNKAKSERSEDERKDELNTCLCCPTIKASALVINQSACLHQIHLLRKCIALQSANDVVIQGRMRLMTSQVRFDLRHSSCTSFLLICSSDHYKFIISTSKPT